MLSYLLGNKGKDLENLFLTSLKLTKTGDLNAPYMHRLIFSAIMHISFFFSSMMVFYNWHQGVGLVGIFSTLVFLFPYSFFYHIKKRALLSWLSYASITNKVTTVSEANSKISEIAWSLRWLAVIEFMIATRTKNEDEKSGIGSFLKNLIIEIFVTVIDVAENYLLPAMVIEQSSMKNAIPKLKEMKNNIPAALGGAFGFDLIGDAISSFSSLIYLAIMGGGVGLSFLLGSIVPVMLRSNIGGHVLFILPTVLSFFLCSYIKSFIKISATSLKAIYFSIFYVSLNKPLEISESFREEVTNYLNFKDSSAVKSVKNNIRNIVEVSSKNQESTNTNKKSPISAEKVQVTKKTNNIDPKLVKKAQLYIIEMKNKGASDQQIISFFTNKGWPEDLVRQLIDSKQEAV